MKISYESSGCYNLKLDKKSSYLTMFVSQVGRYRFTKRTVRVLSAGDIFQLKIDKILKDLPNVFGFVDDTPIEGYDADGRLLRETWHK